ncbi:Hypothetical predicted protein [Pelobates cultripes]|uniref:Uncharacterized protein n=1 Tax=Pelobates cultripes TaxID=61616 RepID=A0AAD1RQC3_PELCU|nr:Hypothetical predicted protein [Pelobates cultripes]
MAGKRMIPSTIFAKPAPGFIGYNQECKFLEYICPEKCISLGRCIGARNSTEDK